MRGRSYDRPMSRFQLPLCVNVAGLGEVYSTQVAERIRANTLAAQFKVADPGCVTNALVIVVKDPARLIERLREEQPHLFDHRVNQRILRAQRRGDAAVGWSVHRINDKRGNPLGEPGAAVGAAGAALFDNAGAGVPTNTRLGTSKYTINFSVERVYSVLVFDVERLTDVHLDQLADYATMRLLATPQPTIDLEPESPADSILTLFDLGPFEAPQQMTQIDRAFLRALYTMRPNDASSRLEGFVLASYDEILTEDCEAGRRQACATVP
jgi:hypothetical protein